MLNKHYKLASNFNCVEFDIDNAVINDHLNEYYFKTGVEQPEDEEVIKYILQKEYDILSSIEGCDIPPAKKVQSKPITPPSKTQADCARSLGMKNPEKHDKKEVWQYINDHKDDCEE